MAQARCLCSLPGRKGDVFSPFWEEGCDDCTLCESVRKLRGMVVSPQGNTIMKETIASLLRHAFTALAGLGTFMYSQGYIGAEDVVDVNASGAAMSDALSALVVAILVRLFIKFSGKVIGAHVNDGKNNNGFLGLLLLGAVGLLGFGLPSCSPSQVEAAKAVPIKACYTSKDGARVCYSSKDGVEVDVRAGK